MEESGIIAFKVKKKRSKFDAKVLCNLYKLYHEYTNCMDANEIAWFENVNQWFGLAFMSPS